MIHWNNTVGVSDRGGPIFKGFIENGDFFSEYFAVGSNVWNRGSAERNFAHFNTDARTTLKDGTADQTAESMYLKFFTFFNTFGFE